ncbi:hypothetical protein AC579_1730 [Pseudocercospora musae]|uniref:C2H2-type domain-containing protein n=1 Tax=Pseudocercospora musae TaxID=113226 RepID=A0A139IEX6_9PEZI|nr:hypothetical protein AC579_1730 [Pseudocercospora musae]
MDDISPGPQAAVVLFLLRLDITPSESLYYPIIARHIDDAAPPPPPPPPSSDSCVPSRPLPLLLPASLPSSPPRHRLATTPAANMSAATTTTTTNPRRRPARATDPANLIDALQNMSLRKGDTFHPNTNTSKSSFWDPLESRPKATSMPLRSATSPKSLEDLLLGAGERQVASLLNRVDQAVAAKSKTALGNVLSEPDVLPLPSFMTVNGAASLPERAQKTRTRHHSHSSDSGIGSSIADSDESGSTAKQSTRTVRSAPAGTSQSFNAISDAAGERGLSKYAADQIHKHIIKPILAEESLEDFHDLIKDVPARIGSKDIKTLRDLEKTLIFLAPDYSATPSKYLQFCERTIRVLHTTVTTLHESDQRSVPKDRPYTQGYFFDLVEQVCFGSQTMEAALVIDIVSQIRRYATILAATREAEANGQKPENDAMDTAEDPQVKLHAGMTHGKPAELIYTNAKGKAISLADGRTVLEEELASSSMKRPAGYVDDDDDALRSMARRKKNAKPEIHTCELCSKEFKRPCDLTKHVKTHERPWKCPEIDCKYHEYGWPTEKERDRHVNDKHTSAPSLYHCLFKPCPYTSKRESNCKQHMEKAHGWNYVRSKSNGKGRASTVTRLSQASVPPSPSSAMLTPLTPIAPSPSTHSWSESSRRGSMAPPPTAGPSNYNTPSWGTPAPDFVQHFNMDNVQFDFNDIQSWPTSAFPITPAMSEERRPSTSLSSHSMQFDGSSFDDASPHLFNFNDNDFQFPENFQQQFTPNSSVGGPSSGAPQVSPGAHMDQTFTDAAMMDAGHGPAEDFTLFGGNSGHDSQSADMFPTLDQSSWGQINSNNYGSHFDNVPTLPAGNTNTALAELFPELADKN